MRLVSFPVALSLFLAAAIFTMSANAQTPPPGCPSGQAVSSDSAGHCCWPAQAWSDGRQVCVGLPQCPTGFAAQGETCVAMSAPGCPAGQSSTPDTAGHCCWSAQVWSMSRQRCVGVPQCPGGYTPQGESCVPAAAFNGVVTSLGPAINPVPGAPVGVAVAGPPATGLVPIRFIAELDYHYEVTVQSSMGGGPQSCSTPCALNLPPGAAEVTVRGDGHFRRRVSIPVDPTVMRLRHLRVGWAVAGGVMTVAAIPLLIVGISGLLDCTNHCRDSTQIVGIVGTIFGAAALIAGPAGMGANLSNHVRPGRPGEVDPAEDRRAALRLTGVGVAPPGGRQRDRADHGLVLIRTAPMPDTVHPAE